MNYYMKVYIFLLVKPFLLCMILYLKYKNISQIQPQLYDNKVGDTTFFYFLRNKKKEKKLKIFGFKKRVKIIQAKTKIS